jgi:hypothetical protein
MLLLLLGQMAYLVSCHLLPEVVQYVCMNKIVDSTYSTKVNYVEYLIAAMAKDNKGPQESNSVHTHHHQWDTPLHHATRTTHNSPLLLEDHSQMTQKKTVCSS